MRNLDLFQQALGLDEPWRVVGTNPAENTLLPTSAAELERAHIRQRELVGDGGLQTGPTLAAFPDLAPEQIQLGPPRTRLQTHP